MIIDLEQPVYCLTSDSKLIQVKQIDLEDKSIVTYNDKYYGLNEVKICQLLEKSK